MTCSTTEPVVDILAKKDLKFAKELARIKAREDYEDGFYPIYDEVIGTDGIELSNSEKAYFKAYNKKMTKLTGRNQ